MYFRGSAPSLLFGDTKLPSPITIWVPNQYFPSGINTPLTLLSLRILSSSTLSLEAKLSNLQIKNKFVI